MANLGESFERVQVVDFPIVSTAYGGAGNLILNYLVKIACWFCIIIDTTFRVREAWKDDKISIIDFKLMMHEKIIVVIFKRFCISMKLRVEFKA